MMKRIASCLKGLLCEAAEGHTNANLPPVTLDVRLPPLHPKLAAQLQFMTTGHGSLFAGKPCPSTLL